MEIRTGRIEYGRIDEIGPEMETAKQTERRIEIIEKNPTEIEIHE